MSDEYQIELSNKVLEYLRNTEQFVVQEAPDFVSNFLIFVMIDTISNILFTLLFFVLSVVAIYIVNKLTSKSDRSHWYDNEDRIAAKSLGFIIFGSTGLISLSFLISHITFLIQLYFTPKVAMIYYFTQMINN